MYYNTKVYLTKSFPHIGSTIEVNYSNYKQTADFVKYCGVYGFAVQSDFGTLTIPVQHIDYIHSTTINSTTMPAPTAVYLVF